MQTNRAVVCHVGCIATSNSYFATGHTLRVPGMMSLSDSRILYRYPIHLDVVAKLNQLICLILSDTTTYICDFHREQCWERWLRKTDNGLSKSREEVLPLLCNVAKSTTEKEFEENVKLLKKQNFWLTSPKLRKWFGNTWLVEAKVYHFCSVIDILLLILN